jgi:hypothetical protein
LRFGAVEHNARRLTRRIEEVLDLLEVLPFDVPADIV